MISESAYEFNRIVSNASCKYSDACMLLWQSIMEDFDKYPFPDTNKRIFNNKINSQW